MKIIDCYPKYVDIAFKMPDAKPLILFYQDINIAFAFNTILLYLENKIDTNKYILTYQEGNLLESKKIIKEKIITELFALNIIELYQNIFDANSGKNDNEIGVLDGCDYYFYEKTNNKYGTVHESRYDKQMENFIKIIYEIIEMLFFKNDTTVKSENEIISKINEIKRGYNE